MRDLHLEAAEGLPETDWRSMVQKSIAAYNDGDIATAFSALEGAPVQVDDPRFYVYRASLLLSVGRVDEAKADIELALKLAPGNGLALALQSVIAVVSNDKQSAMKLAVDAATAEPDSVSVKIALSYAEQANFKLDEALASVQQAVKLDPDASLAWARLAELWMAHGYLDRALESANKAAAINPKEVRIQTVLGFAYLTEIKVAKAKEAFMKAIALNSADPMPRLGLGLAMIREGNLEEGRKQIEIAASLDPNNALIRSYLGKAYYEEKRDPQAQIQFQMAKELDPNDPTPYLYDAIQKQTINRPVEALHDLEKSIELNDNRAVYRSKLLLDNDQAARSVNLGRIYDDLGFQQAALVEGFKSTNLDPTNYSAHRFLSDSYATLPNSEIARASELLQAQLLQPLNNNPVQPSLDKTAPSILGGAGPVDPSFNEYSQLFNRDRNQLLVSGIVGNQSTFGDEVILTGLQGRYSYSLSQLHNDSDGFRENADINQNIYDLFSQVSLTHNLSLQGEVRFNDTKNGDLLFKFDPDNFSPTLAIDTDLKSYRVGIHFAPTPRSDLIFSGLYQDREERQDYPDFMFMTKDILHVYTAEAQYQFHITKFSLLTGAGNYGGPDSSWDSFSLITTTDQIRHSNMYLYSHFDLPSHLIFTIGGSFDHFIKNGEWTFDQNQWNPKLGVTWNPFTSTTVRLAYFRVLRRDLVSNQTIEPTQVAGFQQFFEDLFGTDSKEYGVGVDQKLFSTLFGGVEFTKRHLNFPSLDVDVTPPEVMNFKGEIKRGRAYIYWAPYTWATARAEYFHDQSDVEIYASRVRTDRFPLGLNFYHPLGFYSKVQATYITQDGDFQDPFGNFVPGNERFWIWDASLGYRLPKRFGIFTIGVNNLFDRQFQYYDISQGSTLTQPAQYQPARFIFTKLTLAF
jgi:tetratricopeptide (TPR) repeat protein